MAFEAGHPGFKPVGTKNVSPHPVSVRQRKLETLRLLLEGRCAKEVALILGVTYHTVLQYTQDPEWREQARQLNSKMLNGLDEELLQSLRKKTDILDALAFKALAEMEKILDDKSVAPTLKAKVSTDILDRTPDLSRTRKLDITERTISLRPEDLMAAAIAAREIEQAEAAILVEAKALGETEQARLAQAESQRD